MRQEKFTILENVGDIRIRFDLTHQIVESEYEDPTGCGWEGTLTFTLYPDMDPKENATSVCTLVVKPSAPMQRIREWIARFSLVSIWHMLTIFPSEEQVSQTQLLFNRTLQCIDDQLVALDKVPSYSFTN